MHTSLLPPTTLSQPKLPLRIRSSYHVLRRDCAVPCVDAVCSSCSYVLITMPSGTKHKSRVCAQTLHPVWDQTFSSPPGQTLEQLSALGSLRLHVMDKDRLGSERMGSLEVPPSTLMRLQPGVPMAFRNVALQEATRGKLTFDLRFDALKS